CPVNVPCMVESFVLRLLSKMVRLFFLISSISTAMVMCLIDLVEFFYYEGVIVIFFYWAFLVCF
ncbi:hypothetical protein MMJ09_22890, partial [Bacillus vallismortis]|nr:hypothetical protein [Bacillus vallismortis]